MDVVSATADNRGGTPYAGWVLHSLGWRPCSGVHPIAEVAPPPGASCHLRRLLGRGARSLRREPREVDVPRVSGGLLRLETTAHRHCPAIGTGEWEGESGALPTIFGLSALSYLIPKKIPLVVIVLLPPGCCLGARVNVATASQMS